MLEKGNQEVKLRITEAKQPYIIYYQQEPSITERPEEGDREERLHKILMCPQGSGTKW